MTDYETPHPSELLAEFALGVLSERDAARVRAFIAEDADAMSEVEEMLRVARLLPFAADDREPSQDLRPGLMERIAQEPIPLPVAAVDVEPELPANVTPIRRRTSWLAPVAAAAAAVFVLAAGIGGYAIGSGNEDETVRAEAERQGALLAAVAHGRTDTISTADGAIRVSVVHERGSESAYTWVEGLPPLPEGKAYQAWFTPDMKQFEPGQTFVTHTGGVWLVASEEMENYAAMAFTVEDDEGVQAPTQPPFVVVPLQVTARR